MLCGRILPEKIPASMLAEFLVTDAVLLHAQGHDTLREPQGLGRMAHMSFVSGKGVRDAGPFQLVEAILKAARRGMGIRCRLVRGRPERTVRAVQFTRQLSAL